MKVRLQSQPSHLPLAYTGPLDCFRQSYQADGLRGLYRGISAPLVGAALETSSLFFWERVAQKALYASNIYAPGAQLPLPALFFTGAVSGAFSSLVLTPIELVKCKMQVPANASGPAARAARPGAIVRTIFQQRGLAGFWHGQQGTLIRETGGSAAWFGSKESMTLLFRKLNASTETHATGFSPLPLWQQAASGAVAGMSYNFLFYPADTVKSRMQTSPTAGKGELETTFWQEGKALWRQAGLRGLYRGCGITLLRSAPSSAFIFITFDGLKRQFSMG